MYKLYIKDSFDSAHYLPGHKGKCSKVHGHTWNVEIEVCGDSLNEDGMVTDFSIIKSSLKTTLSLFDHRLLNEIPAFSKHGCSPTAENIARVIYEVLGCQVSGLTSVTVWETASCGVKYEVV